MPVKKHTERLAVGSVAAAKILALIQQERITEARELLSGALSQHAVGDPELLSLKALLAPPKVTLCKTQDVDRSQEHQWIAANREAYQGRWVGGSLFEGMSSLLTRPPLETFKDG